MWVGYVFMFCVDGWKTDVGFLAVKKDTNRSQLKIPILAFPGAVASRMTGRTLLMTILLLMHSGKIHIGHCKKKE
jgi:hypothetical protein